MKSGIKNADIIRIFKVEPYQMMLVLAERIGIKRGEIKERVEEGLMFDVLVPDLSTFLSGM
jgi:hypothetical protein